MKTPKSSKAKKSNTPTAIPAPVVSKPATPQKPAKAQAPKVTDPFIAKADDSKPTPTPKAPTKKLIYTQMVSREGGATLLDPGSRFFMVNSTVGGKNES